MLPGSNLANALADLGYDLRPELDGERILPHAIVEKFARNSDGSLGILTEGSTNKVTTVVTHAGIVKTRRFSFDLPQGG